MRQPAKISVDLRHLMRITGLALYIQQELFSRHLIYSMANYFFRWISDGIHICKDCGCVARPLDLEPRHTATAARAAIGATARKAGLGNTMPVLEVHQRAAPQTHAAQCW